LASQQFGFGGTCASAFQEVKQFQLLAGSFRSDQLDGIANHLSSFVDIELDHYVVKG
jgi:hypothetical protein